MAAPMKIRAQLKGDHTDIKVLMAHPMQNESKDKATGKIKPAHYIEEITITVGGKVVVHAQTGPAISTNPVFGFKVKGGKKGDKVEVEWKDTKGDSRKDEANIS
jgi:sulfur-oxidizing protein SoxZ